MFKGIALAANKIFATDFHNNRVEVFGSKFAAVTLKAGAFADGTLPAGFAPFGIQAVGSKLYVTYALQDTLAHDDVHGAGNGFVDEFSTSGKLIKRIASQGDLDSPWAVVVAPKGWGKYTGDLLVGNFGDGHLTVYDKRNDVVGQLADSAGSAIVIDGLWGLAVGVKTKAAKQQIFFAGGTNDESDGLFGVLTPVLTKTVASANSPTGGLPGY